MNTKQSLNPRQIKFCQEYLLSGNATQSAVKAGYSEKTAYSIGQRLLKHVEVERFLSQTRKQDTERHQVTRDRVILELERLACQNVKLFYDDKGNPLPIHQLSDDAAAAISGLEIEEQVMGTGRNKVVKKVTKIRRYNKDKSLDILAKHFGLIKEDTVPVNLNLTIGYGPDE